MHRHAAHRAPRLWLITVALVGLTVLQVLLLRFAWELKTQAFVNNVTTALTVTAANLENEEIFEGAVDRLVLEVDEDASVFSTGRHIRIAAPDRSPVHDDGREIQWRTVVHADTLRLPDTPGVWQISDGADSEWFQFDTEFGEDAATVMIRGERTSLIRRIVGDLVEVESRPIRERLADAGLDSLLAENLGAVGVTATPAYGVLSVESDSLVYAAGAAAPAALAASPYRARLFPLDMAPPHFDLALHFPDRRAYLAGQIWPFWLASIVFMTLIVHSFVRTLRAHAAQRRYAEHLVDFVNNMTHEFKTPISTVSLASEALARPDIVERPDALRRYNRMIRDENHRMAAQVEKILQIARLESGDFRLNRAPLELDALVTESARAFALQVEQRGGALEVEADTGAVLDADPVHLGAAISNLVDNAVKYAAGPPEVRVTTRRDADDLIVEVADRGPGVAEADRERVFEKYFRGHTGNRHDVKGFGLGLSYVRLVAEAHAGTARLDARPGGGTVATLRVPVLKETRS